MTVPDHAEPRDGVPAVTDDRDRLTAYATALAAGTGPIALDAERASGFRYSQRAYLVQIRRVGAGTALIDPIPIGRLDLLQDAMRGQEWILHAATQDLPCLAELGLRPDVLFDTELAGRLLGRERVSLAALVESELGRTLQKGHGATDWSVRPLSAAQLRYAALDVEWLVELRDHLHAELVRAGKWAWAEQEFDALRGFTPRPRGEDPWRRTSGIHRLRNPRRMAIVRQLWLARDAIAQRTDIAPGRVLPDAAILAAAEAQPTSLEALAALPAFTGRGQRRRIAQWWAAVDAARTMPDHDLPGPAPASDSLPPPRVWADKNPTAFARLGAAREVIGEVADRTGTPAEHLLTPESVRRLCWEPLPVADLDAVTARLRELGARAWQVDLLAGPLTSAINATPSAS